MAVFELDNDDFRRLNCRGCLRGLNSRGEGATGSSLGLSVDRVVDLRTWVVPLRTMLFISGDDSGIDHQ